jgi:hypothetical protein
MVSVYRKMLNMVVPNLKEKLVHLCVGVEIGFGMLLVSFSLITFVFSKVTQL